jgi:serine/threonine-protein kinase
MAPEQARGVSGEPASDVYALGALLFEIVTNEPLHRGSTVLSLLVSAMTGDTGDILERTRAHAVPLGIAELVQRAIDSEPSLRPTPRELAAGIEAALDEEARALGARRSAERHVEDARRSAEEALAGGDVSSRARALREAGRALALDPDNAAATDVLKRLLVQPPAELPPEVTAEVAESERLIVRSMLDSVRMRLGFWLLVVPFAICLGVRSIAGAALTIGSIVLAFGALHAVRDVRHVAPRVRLGLMALTLFAVATVSGVFGPFVFVPVFATTIATMLSTGLDRRMRAVAIALGLGAIFVPFALELAGVLPPSMTIENGAIVLHPRLLSFPPALVTALLVVGHAIAIPVCVTLTGRGWDALDRARRKLALRTWQLERALPNHH